MTLDVYRGRKTTIQIQRLLPQIQIPSFCRVDPFLEGLFPSRRENNVTKGALLLNIGKCTQTPFSTRKVDLFIIILNVGTDGSKQTVQDLIRLLLRNSLICVYTVCHSIYIFLTHFSLVWNLTAHLGRLNLILKASQFLDVYFLKSHCNIRYIPHNVFVVLSSLLRFKTTDCGWTSFNAISNGPWYFYQ